MALRGAVCVLLLAQLCCVLGQLGTPQGVLFSMQTNVQSFQLLPGQMLYNVTVVGASGGGTTFGPYNYAGRGAVVTGTLDLTNLNMTNMSIIVGQRGTTTYFYNAGGGGGGSFLWNPANIATPLVAAGGGAGMNYWYMQNYGNSGSNEASLSTSWVPTTGYNQNNGGGGTQASGGANGYENANPRQNCSGKGWNEIVRNAFAPGFFQNSYYDAPGGYGGGGNGVNWQSGAGGGYNGGGCPFTNGYYGFSGGGSAFYDSKLKSPSLTQYQASTGSNMNSASTVTDGYVLISTFCPTANGTISMSMDLCICRSGISGQICNTSAPLECGAGVISNTSQSNPFPVVTDKSYSQNTLNVVVSAPYTPNRRFNSLAFSGSTNNRCSLYYGKQGYIQQSFSNCTDKFTVALPWTNHTSCGFVVSDTNDATTTWKGTLVMEYEEFFTTVSGYSRVARQSYDIYIAFPRKLFVTTFNMTLFSVVPLEYSFVGEWYDSVSKELTLEIDTVLGYAAAVVSDVPMTINTPSNVIVTQQTQFNNTRCTDADQSLCIQRITFKLKLVNETVCTYNGLYTMNSTITACRNGSYCFPTRFSLSFSVNSGSVCTSVTLTPPISGSLIAYPDTSFSTPYTMFSIGEIGYFRVNVDAGLGNTVSLNFTDIYYEDNKNSGIKYLYNATKMMNDGIATWLGINNTEKYFFLTFQRSIFNIPINTGVLYTFTANCAVVFQGNRKRNIQAVWDMSGGEVVTKTAQTRVSIMAGEEDEAVDNKVLTHVSNHAQDQLSLGAVAAIAVVAAVVALVAGFAGVAMYFKKKYGDQYAAVETEKIL